MQIDGIGVLVGVPTAMVLIRGARLDGTAIRPDESVTPDDFGF